MGDVTTTEEPKGQLPLPPEILSIIFSNLKVEDLKTLMLTHSVINCLAAPSIFRAIRVKGNTDRDTTGLVDFLQRRTNVQRFVQSIDLDELDEGGFRRVLAFGLPNLDTIILQHEGHLIKTISAEEKRALNALIVPKPNLRNCKPSN